MKQHPLDPISLVFGGLLAALGGFLVSSDARWESAGGAWVLPALLVVMGAVILWSTLLRLRNDIREEDEDEPADESGDYRVSELPTSDVTD